MVKRWLLAALALGLMALMLPGCPIKTSQGNQLEASVGGLNTRVDTLEQQVADLKSRFDASSQMAGDAVLGFEQLQQEVGILQGKLDEMARGGQLSPEQITLLRRQLGRQFKALDKRLVTFEKRARLRDVDKGNLEVFTSNVTTAPVDVGKKPKEQDLLKTAIALFNQGNLETAKVKFREFLKLYPKSKRAHTAQFYLAESHFKQGRWMDAILAFDTLSADYPRSSHLAPTYLHMGVAFYEVGQPADAKLFFEKVIASFPKSREAIVARKKLKGLR
ncbi:MAG: tetratricopeptide repeat protein [Candidatus Lernaella stagnicola]|nr:tetratricopeptide repeat protein [Candidatus Lernaella stagnicola]